MDFITQKIFARIDSRQKTVPKTKRKENDISNDSTVIKHIKKVVYKKLQIKRYKIAFAEISHFFFFLVFLIHPKNVSSNK